MTEPVPSVPAPPDVSDAQPDARTEAQAETQVEAQPDARAEAQEDTLVSVQADTQAEAQAETQVEAQPETQVEAQPDALSGGLPNTLSGGVPVALPDGLIRIQVPTPYAVGPVNVYVIQGRRTTLIDVGPPTDEGEAALMAGLAGAGVSPDDIDQIVITHTHVDHHGGLARFLRRHGTVPVAVHAAGRRQFGQERVERLNFYERLFAASGMPSSIRGAIVSGMGQLLALEPDVPVDRWLQDGDFVVMGDGTWRVLHTPGHAGSQICLYHESTATMVTSDHVLPHISSNAIVEPPPMHGGDRPRTLVQYMDGMRRVAALPVALALPGHGDPFVDVGPLVADRIDMHEQRLGHILDRLRDAPASVYQLTEAMFAPRDGEELVLAMSEVLGHLDVLEAREQVTIENRDGISVYHAGGERTAASM